MPLSNAEKQARFREKRDAELEGLRIKGLALLEALARSFEASGCGGLVDNLPDMQLQTWEAMAVLTERLEGYKLVPYRLHIPPGEQVSNKEDLKE